MTFGQVLPSRLERCTLTKPLGTPQPPTEKSEDAFLDSPPRGE